MPALKMSNRLPSLPASAADADGDDASFLIDPSEPCFITRSIYCLRKEVHWIESAGDDEESMEEIEETINELGFCGVDFELIDRCNICNLENSIYESLDSSFIAVTGSRETLQQLLDLRQADCDFRQSQIDELGWCRHPEYDLAHPCMLEPQFELVALHPEKFLPNGSVLKIFNREEGIKSWKTYVPSPDRRLRETPGGLSSALLPSFPGPPRRPHRRLSPFLVFINADLKFREYFRQIELNPPAIPLPDEVLDLMKLTTKLMDLVYLEPAPTPGSEGCLREQERAEIKKLYEQQDSGDDYYWR